MHGIQSSIIAMVVFCTALTSNGYAQMSEHELRAASVLSTNFESLVYTKVSLLSSAEEIRAQLQDRDQALSNRALRLPFLELIGALTALGPDTLDDFKHSYDSVFVGAADFTSPDGIGMVSSRKCYVAVANSGKPRLSGLVFQKAAPFSFGSAEGFAWSLPPFEGHPKPTEYYAGVIAGVYFILANDRATFEETAKVLAVQKTIPTQFILPNGLSGSKILGVHEYWAYRLFDRTKAKDVHAAGINAVPTTSFGLAFFADSANKEGTIDVYSSADQAPTFLQSAPKLFQAPDPGVWRATYTLSNAENVQRTLVEIFYYLGFGIFF